MADAPAIARIDSTQLQRVFDNILSNSIRYRGDNAGKLTIKLWREENSLRINCTDSGVGVPEETLASLFDSFYRTDKARQDVVKGSGLGLAVSKEIIKQMNGEIWVELPENGGLTIAIKLPYAAD